MGKQTVDSKQGTVRKKQSVHRFLFSVHRPERGQILLATLTISLLVLLVAVGVVAFASFSYRQVRRSQFESQTLGVTEAAVEHAIRQLNVNSNYTGEADTPFGEGVFVVSVSGSGNNRIIDATGCIPDCTSPRSERRIRVQVRLSSETVQFFYGVQVDEGGFTLGNNARVTGNIYSNGNVTGGNGSSVGGDATVAGSAAATINQSQEVANGTQSVGQTSSQADIAQSFIPSQTNSVSRIGVYLAKVGNPSNITARILTDNNNRPSRTDLASATIQSSSVGTTASWIEVSFSSPPNLTSGTRYWLLLDGSANSSNYYLWSKDTNNSYLSGNPMYSNNWNTGNPSWTSLTGDQTFRIYMGGVPTTIDNVDVGGTARANTIKDLAVTGDAYFQTLTNSTVGGTQFPNSPDPAREDLPISDGVIADWKNDAEAGGTHLGDFTVGVNSSASLGPRKVQGNLIINSGGTLTVTGTIWITGNITISSICTVRLDPAYGNNSGLIIADGTVVVGNNCNFIGSGNPPSYIMLLTARNAPTETSMDVNNNSTGVIYYAGKSRILFRQNARAKEATAWGIDLENNATIEYESGLQNATFTSGPGAGWSVVTGTWQEIK